MQVRVIQTCMQYGSSAERNEIVTELERESTLLPSSTPVAPHVYARSPGHAVVMFRLTCVDGCLPSRLVAAHTLALSSAAYGKFMIQKVRKRSAVVWLALFCYDWYSGRTDVQWMVSRLADHMFDTSPS